MYKGMSRKSGKYFLSSVVKEQAAMILNWKMLDLDIFYNVVGVTPERTAQRSCGCPNTGNPPGQAWMNSNLIWKNMSQRGWTRWSILVEGLD